LRTSIPTRALAASLTLLPAGCASGPGAAGSADTTIRPALNRVDAIPGAFLVTPVEISGPFDPERLPRVRLEDGRALATEIHWIGVAGGPTRETAREWLDAPGVWATAPASAGVLPGEAGVWSLVAQMPVDAVGQSIWIGSDRVELTWIPNPAGFGEAIQAERIGAERVWEMPLDGAGLEAPGFSQLIAPERKNPARRWRAALIDRGLEPYADPFTPGLEGLTERPNAFADPVLEAYAVYRELRWAAGLALLWRDNPSLAEELKSALVRTARFPGGVPAPAWETRQVALRTLLDALTDPNSGPDRRERAARSFLAAVPAAGAWVIDDTGVTTGVVNLTERPTLTWIEGSGDGGRTGLDVLAPLESRVIAGATAVRDGLGAGSISAHAGEWSARLPVRVAPIEATPPGARLGPFLFDLDMQGTLNLGAPVRPTPPWQTAALVYRDAAESSGDTAAGWSVYIECSRAPVELTDRQTVPPETLRVWLGARGGDAAAIRVSEDGSVLDESPTADGQLAEQVEVTAEPDRWTVRMPVPRRAIDGSELLIGIERSDRFGRRTAWPRPMLPWQTEPGRAAVDLSAWR